MTVKCKACGAEIEFMILPSGQTCPMDTQPRLLLVGPGKEGGYVYRDDQAPGRVTGSRGLGERLHGTFVNAGNFDQVVPPLLAARPPGCGPLMLHVVRTSHFGTCTDPQRFSKRK